MNCPICDKPMHQMVIAWLWCEADHSLQITKTKLRSRNVKLSYVTYPPPDKYICKEHGLPFAEFPDSDPTKDMPRWKPKVQP